VCIAVASIFSTFVIVIAIEFTSSMPCAVSTSIRLLAGRRHREELRFTAPSVGSFP
jgi:hypothetical protein